MTSMAATGFVTHVAFLKFDMDSQYDTMDTFDFDFISLDNYLLLLRLALTSPPLAFHWAYSYKVVSEAMIRSLLCPMDFHFPAELLLSGPRNPHPQSRNSQEAIALEQWRRLPGLLVLVVGRICIILFSLLLVFGRYQCWIFVPPCCSVLFSGH